MSWQRGKFEILESRAVSSKTFRTTERTSFMMSHISCHYFYDRSELRIINHNYRSGGIDSPLHVGIRTDNLTVDSGKEQREKGLMKNDRSFCRSK